jgi:hypothetical protein
MGNVLALQKVQMADNAASWTDSGEAFVSTATSTCPGGGCGGSESCDGDSCASFPTEECQGCIPP